MIMTGILVSCFFWANLSSVYVWVVLMVTIGFGAIGFTTIISKSRSSRTKAFLANRVWLSSF